MTPRTPADYTKAADERARRGRREIRLQLLPMTAAAIEALSAGQGRQAFSDAVNALLERYENAGR